MNKNAMLTGKPSIDRPWMKFYPDVLRGIQVPACTVEQYLSVQTAVQPYRGEISDKLPI